MANIITVTETGKEIVSINTPGPQGPQGPQGVPGPSGSATDISALNTFTGSAQTEIDSLTAATGSYLTSLPNGVLSSSAQISTDISGAFTAASSSFSTRTTTLEANPVFSAAGISGSFNIVSSSFSTRITTNETITSKTLLSSSAQIASDISGAFASPFTAAGISGSFNAASSSFSTRVTTNEANITSITSSLDANRVVFTTTGGQLATDAGMTYDSTNDRLTVQSLDVVHLTSSFITASRIHTSGSNIFGDDTTDTQTLIGTTKMTGSAEVTGSLGIRSLTSGTQNVLEITNNSGVKLLQVGNTDIITIGSNASATSAFSQVWGGNASSAGEYSVVIGYDADHTAGTRAIAIGASAKAAGTGAVGIGVGAQATEHSIVIGRNIAYTSSPINSVVFSTFGGNNVTYSTSNVFEWYNTHATTPNLRFLVGPASASYWSGSGNFGFNTTSPLSTVDIVGDLNVSNGTKITGSLDVSGSITTFDINMSTWTLGADGGSNYYYFTGPGDLGGTEQNPDIHLTRGQKYRFYNPMNAHPFQIQDLGGSAFNTGVTNNGVSLGFLSFDVPMDGPTHLKYQCTAHAAMIGNIYISDARIASGSFSGSFQGDGSNLTGISTDPFPFTGDAQITGSLLISGSKIHLRGQSAIPGPILELESIGGGSGKDVYVKVGDASENYAYAFGADDSGNTFRISSGTYSGVTLGTNDKFIIDGNNIEFPAGNISGSATSTASFGTYIGDGSQLTGISSTPFPFTGDAQITGSLLISGSTPKIEFDNDIVLQQPSTTSGGIRIGYNTQIYEASLPQYSIAIGHSAMDGPSTGTNYDQSVAIGRGAVGGYYSVAIGGLVDVNGYSTAIAIGSSAQTNGNNAISIGYNAQTAASGISIGKGAISNQQGTITIGTNTTNNQTRTIVLNATTAVATNTDSKAFKTYMSTQNEADFAIIHDGVSYINGTGIFEFRNTGGIISTGSLTVSGSKVDFTEATAISGSTFSGSFVGDGSQLTGISAASGKFGIANASGEYTYYSDLSSSLQAATAGDTIQIFTNVIDTSESEFHLKNGVNFNFNGNEFFWSGSASTDGKYIFNDNNVAVSCSFYNGKIRVTQAITSGIMNRTLWVQNSDTEIINHGFEWEIEQVRNASPNYSIANSGKIIGGRFLFGTKGSAYLPIQLTSGAEFRNAELVGVNVSTTLIELRQGEFNECSIFVYSSANLNSSPGSSTAERNFQNCNIYLASGNGPQGGSVSYVSGCNIVSLNGRGVYITNVYNSIIRNANDFGIGYSADVCNTTVETDSDIAIITGNNSGTGAGGGVLNCVVINNANDIETIQVNYNNSRIKNTSIANKRNESGNQEGIQINTGLTNTFITNCTFDFRYDNTGNYGITAADDGTEVYFANNTFMNCTPFNPTKISQAILNTNDPQGNISLNN